MDVNEYVLELLVRDRLAALRAAGERAYLLGVARQTSQPLRVALGYALVRLGRRLAGARESDLTVLRGV